MNERAAGTVHLRQDGPVARLLIDHPTRRNALTYDMWESLPRLVQAADADAATRVIVLEGVGTDFASGSDISQFAERRSTPEGVALYNATSAKAVQSLASVRKPVVARIRGSCIGAGMALALHCDLRYASGDARFSIPAGKLGLGYRHLWLQRLCTLAGPAKAKEMLFTADIYDAQAAFGMGLVNHILDDLAFEKTVAKLCSMAPLSLVASKVAIDQAISPDAYDHAACEAAVQACFDSTDYIEGRNAFEAKRKPEFIGR